MEWRFLKQLVQEKQGDTSAKYLCASEGSRQEPQATKHFGDTLLPWLYPNSLILQIFPFRKCHSAETHFSQCYFWSTPRARGVTRVPQDSGMLGRSPLRGRGGGCTRVTPHCL